MPPNITFEEEVGDIVLGQVLHSSAPIPINEGRNSVIISVTNTADRPIQVGSHYHFIETNAYLKFNRRLSYGKRLNIAAGNSVRFEPGESKSVSLVDIGGRRVVRGGNNLCDGPISADPAVIASVLNKLTSQGFLHADDDSDAASPSKKRRVDDASCMLFCLSVKNFSIVVVMCSFACGLFDQYFFFLCSKRR